MSGSDRKSRGRNREEALFPAPSSKNVLPADHATMLDALKERIRTERLSVTLAANAAMVQLYWDIGRAILERQQQQGWGAKVIDRLSHDLTTAFPDMTGLSPRNLLFMRSFAEAYPDPAIVKQLVSQIPWGHIIRILQKVKDPDDRLWYARKTIENGWSRNILAMQIEKSKKQLIVEYALRGFCKPMGVADWETRLTETLPEELKGSLPSVEEIEAELGGEEEA